jgi:RloB-like protein
VAVKMPERKFKPRERKSGFRDARLIIIAAEGTQTEKKYFHDLALDDKYRNPKVHVEVLSHSTDSSPAHIIRVLDEFRRTYSLRPIDELWLVIDIDKWPVQMLSDILTQSRKSQYHIAVSNPCFEVWLLLHRASFDDYTDDELNELVENKRTNLAGRTRLEKELMKLCGSYTKENLDTSHYIPFVEIAVERAQATDTNPEHGWPNQIGTRVYLLVQSIINRR